MTNILILSTSDIGSGAARAAYRLHKGLQSLGHSSLMLVQNKFGDDHTVLAATSLSPLQKGLIKLRRQIDRLPLKCYSRNEPTMFSPQWFPDVLQSRVSQLNPDVISLHGVCGGYLRIETVAKFGKPIVWTLHDMWAFTGGCHYTQACDRYTQSCGQCPQLNSTKEQDLSRWVWERKSQTWPQSNLSIVTPSKWMAQCARESSLLRNIQTTVIPNSIDIDIYKPVARHTARELIHLPKEKKLVLFGAINGTNDQRKGFHLLQKALKYLGQSEWRDKLELVVFGSSESNDTSLLGFKTHYLDRINDETLLATIYAAADAFVVPSVQDNLPNTVMESLSCGTPCVAFDIGGMADMIEHHHNGYLAKPFDITDFAQGIDWILSNEGRQEELSHRARQKVEVEFILEKQAQRYFTLFQEKIDLVTEKLNA